MEYTKADIANILKKKKRTIQHWTDFGLVIPDIVPSQGRGKARVYSDRNLVEFAMVEYLSRWHVELGTIKAILDGLRKGYDEIKNDDGSIFETINFSDFFQSNEWGGQKELAFIELVYKSEISPYSTRSMHVFRTLRVLSDPQPNPGPVEGVFNSHRSRGELIQKYYWLGEIKRTAAIELLGMESLLSIKDS